jgi:hypothetical protein
VYSRLVRAGYNLDERNGNTFEDEVIVTLEAERLDKCKQVLVPNFMEFLCPGYRRLALAEALHDDRLVYLASVDSNCYKIIEYNLVELLVSCL